MLTSISNGGTKDPPQNTKWKIDSTNSSLPFMIVAKDLQFQIWLNCSHWIVHYHLGLFVHFPAKSSVKHAISKQYFKHHFIEDLKSNGSILSHGFRDVELSQQLRNLFADAMNYSPDHFNNRYCHSQLTTVHQLLVKNGM